eukprot:TRINITY_DN1495_c0_g1_i1.p1 TRINITY_DN1495_c0_g1~~TRINITY_DN1495_c0_g1_i1.p1  ORF type:complete len:265 (+),score=63.82 TRINITY_DN1495_c0_g1_i1:165-959(+)
MGCGASNGQVVDGPGAAAPQPKAYTAPNIEPLKLAQPQAQPGNEVIKARIALDGETVDTPEADSDAEDRGTPKEVMMVGPSFRPGTMPEQPKNKPAEVPASNKPAAAAAPVKPTPSNAPASQALSSNTANNTVVKPPPRPAGDPLAVRTNNLPDLKPKQSFIPALVFKEGSSDTENNPSPAGSLKSPSQPATHVARGPDGAKKALPELKDNGRPKLVPASFPSFSSSSASSFIILVILILVVVAAAVLVVVVPSRHQHHHQCHR